MGKVVEHLLALIQKQVDEHGIVVWYDPGGVYAEVAKELTLPDTAVLHFQDSFFRLRREIEPFLEFVDDEGRMRPDSHIPPRLVVYVPLAQADTEYALVEVESAGVVMAPGATPWQRNTRLRVIAEHVFKKIAPESAADIARQVEEGRLNLRDLDQLSSEVEQISTGTLKLIFGTASPQDVLLMFVATPQYDEELERRQALPELAKVIKRELGIEVEEQASPAMARHAVRRTLLLTDFLAPLALAEHPAVFSQVPLPQEEQHCRNACQLCHVWRQRLDFLEAYLAAARNVEQELGLAALDLPWENLAAGETFPVLETKLLAQAESQILEGNPLNALHLAERRKNSFWARQEPSLQLRWTLVENSARVMILGEAIRTELSKVKKAPEALFRLYTRETDPWCQLDRLYRHLERQYASFDLEHHQDPDLLEKVVVQVRQHYSLTVTQCTEALTQAFEKAGFKVSGFLSQRNIYQQQVFPRLLDREKTAYVLVDALRYEMGQELAEGLQEEFEVTLTPAIAQLPTVTPVGMAALMPEAEKGLEIVEVAGGNVAITVGGAVLKDRAARVKYLQEKVSRKIAVLKLRDLLKPSKKHRQEIKEADLILVTSQEIDRWGEETEDESEARLYMDEVLDKLRRGIRRLASMGVPNLVITADHGHLFGEAFEGGAEMDPPGGKTIALHNRVWIGQGGKAGDGYVRVLAHHLAMGGDLELAFPKGLAVFKTRGVTGAYCHGGISFQEMVIPVISLRAKELRPYVPKTTKVLLEMDKTKVTTRFFSVKATYGLTGLMGAEEIRINLSVRANRKEVGFAVMAAYGFEEGTREIVLRRDKPNAITIMITEENLTSISVHALDAISQVELARLENIPVAIYI
ncbi:MAG: PglZ domain-containing protein [Desulfobaccales bacterium]